MSFSFFQYFPSIINYYFKYFNTPHIHSHYYYPLNLLHLLFLHFPLLLLRLLSNHHSLLIITINFYNFNYPMKEIELMIISFVSLLILVEKLY